MTRAIAIADVVGGTVLATIDIAAPPERVFRALTDSSEVPRWWGSADSYQTTSHTADLRPGGAWSARGRSSKGGEFTVSGTFLEVVPPTRVVFTWRYGWGDGGETQIAYQIEPIPGGSRLTVRHDGFTGRPADCADHAQGWERVLAWLSGHAVPDAPASFFFCKLLPPRPTFAGDMTPPEAEVMKAHVGYWSTLAAGGRALLYGPVMDAAGPYGVGILRATADELAELCDGDPAIQAGRGFRYETSAMPRVTVGG